MLTLQPRLHLLHLMTGPLLILTLTFQSRSEELYFGHQVGNFFEASVLFLTLHIHNIIPPFPFDMCHKNAGPGLISG